MHLQLGIGDLHEGLCDQDPAFTMRPCPESPIPPDIGTPLITFLLSTTRIPSNLGIESAPLLVLGSLIRNLGAQKGKASSPSGHPSTGL